MEQTQTLPHLLKLNEDPGFHLTFQNGFVSFFNENNRKTDLKFCTPWLVDGENTSDLHLVLKNHLKTLCKIPHANRKV